MTTSAIAQMSESFAPHFVGDVVTKWLRHEGEDRLMELREDFGFFDSRGNEWTAPEGFIFDGTTIPRALWTVFGDPFIGDYRRAAVTHDLLCTPLCRRCGGLAWDFGQKATPRYLCRFHPTAGLRHRVSSDEAAEIMHEAMRVDGVTELRASIIRRAVMNWGPQFVRG